MHWDDAQLEKVLMIRPSEDHPDCDFHWSGGFRLGTRFHFLESNTNIAHSLGSL